MDKWWACYYQLHFLLQKIWRNYFLEIWHSAAAIVVVWQWQASEVVLSSCDAYLTSLVTSFSFGRFFFADFFKLNKKLQEIFFCLCSDKIGSFLQWEQFSCLWLSSVSAHLLLLCSHLMVSTLKVSVSFIFAMNKYYLVVYTYMSNNIQEFELVFKILQW